MKKDLVVKDNSLINASYYLDLVEQRLILLAIIEARKLDQQPNEELYIYAQSYANHFDVTTSTAYTVLNTACKNLFERRFSYQRIGKSGDVETVVSRWVQRAVYAENGGYIAIKFSDDVMPLITKLEKHFTSYELEQVKDLTSIYAIRLYELLVQWRGKGRTPQIKLSELRNKLGILESEYDRIANFKAKVLDFAISQINEHTDITATYEQHKQGRIITGFTFSFKSKPKAKDEQGRDSQTGDLFSIEGLSDAQLARVARNKQFIADYNHMVSPNSSANNDINEWVREMAKRLKASPEKFNKRPIDEYLI